MNVNKKYSYLAKNTLLFTIANLSNKLIVFFLLPFYTAYLSMEEYAIIDLISITQQLIFPIVTLDITEAVIRFGIEKYNVKSTIFTIGFIFTVSGNLILGIGCAAANSLFMDNSHFMLYFFVFNLVISVNTLLSSFLRTVDKVYVITIASIINTIIITILNILLISKYEMGIKGYYISYTIGNVVAIVIMCACVKLKEYLKKLIITDVHQYLVPMLKYAIPLIPNALFWWINSSLDRYFLTIMSTLSSVGMYAAANKLPSVLSTLTSIFQQSWGCLLYTSQ